MESHVSGDAVSPTLGALRCDILAVLIGNPLFSKEEQLRANHHVHECEDAGHLALWLHNVHREIKRREQATELATQGAKKLLFCGSDAPERELRRLTTCSSLTKLEKVIAQTMLADATGIELFCIAHVGQLYVKVLRRKGLLSEN